MATRAEKALAVMDAMRDGTVQIHTANGFEGRFVAVDMSCERHHAESNDDPVEAGWLIIQSIKGAG